MSGSRRARLRRRVYFGYLGVSVVVLSPIAYMMWSSVRVNADVLGGGLGARSGVTLENYIRLFAEFDAGRGIANGVIIAGASTIVGVLLGTPAAYAASRIGTSRLRTFLLSPRIAPGVLLVIVVFTLATALRATGSISSFAVLILAHLAITLPIVIWLLIPRMDDIPREVEEAGFLDGASGVRVFLAIVIPLASGGIAVAATIAFIFSWNFLLFALALATPETMPLTVQVFSYIGEGQTDMAGLMAASTILSLPALAIAILAERRIVDGFSKGVVG